MFEDPNFESEKIHAVFSACNGCRHFRALCYDGNAGYGCALGNENDNFIPFDFYASRDSGIRKQCILDYQKNAISDECIFHTQCSMMNFLEDESEIDSIASDGASVSAMKFASLDEEKKKSAMAPFANDGKFIDWISSNSEKITAIILENDGIVHGSAFMAVECDEDYSWVQPSPPEKHYMQKGSRILAVRYIHADDEIGNSVRMMMSVPYMTAIFEKCDEIYAVAGIRERLFLTLNGFHSAGYRLNGNETDEEAGSFVLVKKLMDMNAGHC